jgi:hypothetical protein
MTVDAVEAVEISVLPLFEIRKKGFYPQLQIGFV